MKQCNNCWMKEFKDTKDRPMTCFGCELNYHWNKLFEPLFDLLLVKIPKKLLDFYIRIIKNIRLK